MQRVRKSIWEEYARNQDPVLKRDIVTAYIPLVKYVVGKIGVPASQVDSLVKEGDLIQYGVLGLLEAIERYEPSRGVKFESFAIPRIRGMVQDELRKLDWVPRSVRKKARIVDRIEQKVENDDSANGVKSDIAGKLALTEDELADLMEEARHVHHGPVRETEGYSLDDIASEDANQLEELGDQEAKTMLGQLIEHLPNRQRLVVTMYYYENLTFKEIAGVLGLSDSRVFQIHATVLRDLREKMKGYV
jgi:RNA polymerase sigma factor for flagellar operon FliA